MTEALNEQLSALLDGELPPEECELLLKRLERDPELRARFSRYALVGEALRGRRADPAAPLFVARVHAAIAAVVPVPVLERVPSREGRPRLVAGLAVAATVAVAAVLLLARAPGSSAPEPSPARVAEVKVPASPALAPSASERPSRGPTEITPPEKPRPANIPSAELAHYVVAHSDFASQLPSGAMLTGLMVEEPVAEAAGPAPPAGSPPP